MSKHSLELVPVVAFALASAVEPFLWIHYDAQESDGPPNFLNASLCALHLFCSQNFFPLCSATGATLDTGGWLTLYRQELSPCKMHQASLGALAAGMRDATTGASYSMP